MSYPCLYYLLYSLERTVDFSGSLNSALWLEDISGPMVCTVTFETEDQSMEGRIAAGWLHGCSSETAVNFHSMLVR